METKKHSWHGPKQIWIMIYTAILFLIGTSIIGGNNNTVFPMFSEIRGFDINIINIVSGIACIMKAIGVIVLAKAVRKMGPKNLVTPRIGDLSSAADRIRDNKKPSAVSDRDPGDRIPRRRL